MCTALEMKARLNAFDIKKELVTVVAANPNAIADANRDKLLKGKDREGNYMPRYDQDPYFKTIAQARGYEVYKSKVSPNSEKPREVKDYYINGWTHQHIHTQMEGDSVKTWADTPWEDHIERDKGLGINPDSVRELWTYFWRPKFLATTTDRTGMRYTPFGVRY